MIRNSEFFVGEIAFLVLPWIGLVTYITWPTAWPNGGCQTMDITERAQWRKECFWRFSLNDIIRFFVPFSCNCVDITRGISRLLYTQINLWTEFLFLTFWHWWDDGPLFPDLITWISLLRRLFNASAILHPQFQIMESKLLSGSWSPRFSNFAHRLLKPCRIWISRRVYPSQMLHPAMVYWK